LSSTDALAARQALVELLDGSGIAIPDGALDRLERFVKLLLDANERVNLTRVVEPGDIARLHLLDALAALPILDARTPVRALDLGSGGGIPGVPLAVARPQTRWTLVDAAGRKTSELRSFVDAIGLDNVEVVTSRAELLGHNADHREAYDVVAARACAPLPVLAEYALPLIRVGGGLVAWKGRIADTELTSGTTAAARLGGAALVVRETGIAALGDHRFVLIDKASPTDAAFPRRPGVPARRPLG
jgi:16S rRNA (guanine527-N7)-methyltransferase